MNIYTPFIMYNVHNLYSIKIMGFLFVMQKKGHNLLLPKMKSKLPFYIDLATFKNECVSATNLKTKLLCLFL